jgi:hypothetical protein
MGYVGPEVAKYLRARRPKATIHGFGNALFRALLDGLSGVAGAVS